MQVTQGVLLTGGPVRQRKKEKDRAYLDLYFMTTYIIYRQSEYLKSPANDWSIVYLIL